MMDNEIDIFTAALGKVREPVVLELTVAQALVLIVQLQLACRHPSNIGPTRRTAEGIARVIQDAIGRDSPEAGRLLERGWHEVFDVPREGT